MALYNAGRDQQAVQTLLACLPLFEPYEQRNREFLALCVNLGAALTECGQSAAAEDALGKALQIVCLLGDEMAQARAHFNLGNLARQSNSRQSCHHHYLQVITCATHVSIAAKHLQASCCLNLSQLLLSMRQLAAARERLQQLDPLLPAAERDAELRWSLHMQQGHLALQEQHLVSARASFVQALAIAQAAGQPGYVA